MTTVHTSTTIETAIIARDLTQLRTYLEVQTALQYKLQARMRRNLTEANRAQTQEDLFNVSQEVRTVFAEIEKLESQSTVNTGEALALETCPSTKLPAIECCCDFCKWPQETGEALELTPCPPSAAPLQFEVGTFYRHTNRYGDTLDVSYRGHIGITEACVYHPESGAQYTCPLSELSELPSDETEEKDETEPMTEQTPAPAPKKKGKKTTPATTETGIDPAGAAALGITPAERNQAAHLPTPASASASTQTAPADDAKKSGDRAPRRAASSSPVPAPVAVSAPTAASSDWFMIVSKFGLHPNEAEALANEYSRELGLTWAWKSGAVRFSAKDGAVIGDTQVVVCRNRKCKKVQIRDAANATLTCCPHCAQSADKAA